MFTKLFPDNNFSSSSIIDIYQTGEYYKNYVLEEQYYPYQYDGWKQRKRYGLVDLNNNIIYPKQSSLLEYTNNTNNIHKNLNFVVDAFKDLKKYQDELLKTNKTKNASIFTKLNVYKSTESVPDLYLLHLQKLYNIFSQIYIDDLTKRKITDIFSFMDHFIKFLTIVTRVTPFNRSVFITSKFAPPLINGLTISLDNVKLDANYRIKANNYIDNPEFDHFIATAAKFGFFVDRNYPFNIVADLESPIMKSYAKNRGYNNITEIFDNCYFKAYSVDLESLKNVILSFWNTFAYNNQSQIINSNKLSTEIIYFNQLTIDLFEQQFNINWQLRLYLYLRILEENININQNKFENLYKESIKINKFSNTDNSLMFINQKIIELKTPSEETLPHLTTADVVVRMLSENIDPFPLEGINF